MISKECIKIKKIIIFIVLLFFYIHLVNVQISSVKLQIKKMHIHMDLDEIRYFKIPHHFKHFLE